MAKWKSRRISIAFKLSFLIVLVSFILRLITMILQVRSSHEVILGLAKDKLQYLVSATANKIEGDLKAVEVAPLNMAAMLESDDTLTKAELLSLIRNTVHSNNYVYGSTAAFEPGAFDPAQKYFAPYFYELSPGGDTEMLYLSAPSYDYFTWEWYAKTRQLQKPYWSEPYMDPAVHKLMSTYSVPFFKTIGGTRKFAGVVTADITLETLVAIVNDVKLYHSGRALMLSRNGTFLSHPDPSMTMHETIFSIAKHLNDEKLADVGTQMIHGKTGFSALKNYADWGPSWIFFTPIESGWSLAVIIPEKELYAEFDRTTRRYIWMSVWMFSALLVMIILIIRRATNPLQLLAGKARDIAKGNLNAEIPALKTNDEVSELSGAFENMRVSLKDYIKNLEETTAANSRFESELKIARNIQMSFLPRTFPPFPDREEFDLYAYLKPAKEVGGDLYDFFIAENGTLYFLVGDVSDKGVPAALFMAATKTLMRGFSHQGTSPAKVMTRVNQELCLYNEELMFVTLFCGALNLQTGELTYSNAGHNPPVLVRDGIAKYMHPDPGFVMGVDPSFIYEEETMKVLPGDVLVVYSDGITEAMNSQKKVYSEERLIEVVQRHHQGTASEIVESIKDDVTTYVAGHPQSDDITLLVFRFNGTTVSAAKEHAAVEAIP